MPATYSGTGSTSTAGVWTAIVTVDGSDVSSRVVGEIRIDAEESSARTAEFTIRPAAGTSFAVAVGREIGNDRHRRQCQRDRRPTCKGFSRD